MNVFKKSPIFLACLLSMSLGHAQTQKVDAIVLGGGAAGLTSAIYLSRAGLSTLVLEGPTSGGAITQSNNVYNWPGYKELPGLDLMERVREQAETVGAVLCKEEVIEVDLSKRPFSVTAQDVYDKSKKRKIEANVCIVALGAAANKLDVQGESAYWSRGVYTCAVCDGALYKDKVVAVVGGGDSALLEAEYLSGIAKKVYLLNRKDAFKGIDTLRKEKLLALPNVEVLYNVRVKEIKGDGQAVNALNLIHKDSKESSLAVDALFLAIGAKPNTKILSKQLELDDQGYIVLKKGCETSELGVFAAGDVADPIFKQAIIASGEGAKAAMQATDYLRSAVFKKAQAIKVEKKEEKIGKVIEVTSLSQLKEVVAESRGMVLVDFYATWCGPCKYLAKFTDRWAEELKGKATLCKVNVDLARDVAMRYRIQSMPTVVALGSEGQEITRKLGVQEIIDYVNRLKN